MRTVSKANLNIAIARDPAFNFSYEENIHFLSTLGKITYFSPLRDDCLPEADFVYLPGGYPELYLSELSMNSGMRESIHSFVEVGAKLLAEWWGMMYLCKEIIGTDGNAYPMAGVLPQSATMENMKLRLGYRTLCYKNDVLRGMSSIIPDRAYGKPAAFGSESLYGERRSNGYPAISLQERIGGVHAFILGRSLSERLVY